MCLCRNWQADSKMYMEILRIKYHQNKLEKDKTGGFILPDFKTHYKATVIKRSAVGIGQHRYQSSQIRSPETDYTNMVN